MNYEKRQGTVHHKQDFYQLFTLSERGREGEERREERKEGGREGGTEGEKDRRE